MNSDEMRRRLEHFVAQHLNVESVSIDDLRRLPGGSSRETWFFRACYTKGGTHHTLPLVLRRDPPGSILRGQRRDEFLLLQAAGAAGVPVPRMYWLADEEETLGGPFFLMEHVEGETLARRLLRDPEYAQAREAMTAQLGAVLAAIHRIDRQEHQLHFLGEPSPGVAPAQEEIDRYEMIYRAITPDPHPAFELAFRWLRERIPHPAGCAVVHGDFRIGNVIFGREGVRSILDWELAHAGDPMEDLGWICVRSWRFGNDDKPVGGIGEREELFSAYEGAGGFPVDPEQVRFWEILGNLKWGIMTIMQAKNYLDGHVRSVELASIGRRTAETELELMDLME